MRGTSSGRAGRWGTWGGCCSCVDPALGLAGAGPPAAAGVVAGGDAPGLAFETAQWIHGHEIAAICCDTWGCEVRPNETTEAQQPWHWVVIPMIGISMGEIFNMGELAEDCADDGVYEFFLTATPEPFVGGVGSPVAPVAIK